MWLRKFSLIQRLGIIVALITLLFVLLTAVVLNRHYEALKQKSYDENQHLVEVVHTMLSSFAARADVDEATAKQQALEAVKALRYDGSNYFWIQDQTPSMVMHPIKPALDGQDLRTFKDGNGKAFFIEMAQKVKSKVKVLSIMYGRFPVKSHLPTKFPTLKSSSRGDGQWALVSTLPILKKNLLIFAM